MTDPWAPQPSQPTTPMPSARPPLTQHQGPPPQGPPPQGPPPQGPPPQGPPPKPNRFKRLFTDPLSIVLVVVIVLALAIAGLVGAEMYARHVGNQTVAKATSCVVQDNVTASFGATPFLLQHFTRHYSSISVTTAGNQIRDAKGMKAQIQIDDVRLENKPDSKGTIGSLEATITWTTDGINETIKNQIPLVGPFISGVTANPSNGTFELAVPLGSIVVKPAVVDGGISLEVQQLTGLGFVLPRESVQPALDAFAAQVTKNYPLGIKAESVQVTDTGVTAKFGTKNATIPVGEQDPCFAGL